MASLTNLPVELLVDNLLPFLDVPDLLHLASANKNFHELLKDDTFWKRKLEEDFNFTPKVTARTSGWRFIYMGIRNPCVYVWGEKGSGRLGLTKFPKTGLNDVSFPVELRIPGARIVNIVAGGMSFHALDSDGNVHVWGGLNGSQFTLNSDGFSEPGKQAHHPLKLAMPAPTRAISCGRLHSATLDANNHVWNFLCWGRPFRLISSLLDCSSPVHTPAQIECGWAFTSVLTMSKDVLVWFPFGQPMDRAIMTRNSEFDSQNDKKALSEGGSIQCFKWELPMDPVRLPSLPSLPKLTRLSGAMTNDQETEEPHLIQIAALDNNLIGLTNRGHVLKFGSLVDESATENGRWEYLPYFSEAQRIRNSLTVLLPEEHHSITVPETLTITHISAHFQKFIAYSSGPASVVLMGLSNTTADDPPQIIPALQNRDVISVILGDYHNCALTADGELFTWGAYSRGALGLGDPTALPVGAPGGFATENARLAASERRSGTPPDVNIPSRVTFGKGKKFCFAACAAGWHTGALVIDLEEHGESEDRIDSEQEDDSPVPGHADMTPQPPGTVPLMPVRGTGAGIFRIGFAGRGLQRGFPHVQHGLRGRGRGGINPEGGNAT